ncbi:MAG: hypothetical protein L0332_23950 [Chloroflexi bacterium]|nr:hypothetical protein [Chloroflexota bacterium]MCI0729747.1 hypothetical protein [Chloroflexota bacterium]
MHRAGKHQIVAELPDGHKQLIPARWTETDSIPAAADELLFSPGSLRALVTMVAALFTQQ